jgi:hypothetical protein
MKQKRNQRKQIFRYARFVAKATGLGVTVVAISIFMLQYLPMYLKIGTRELIGFIIICLLWALDIVLTTLDDFKKLGKEIDENH